MSRVFEGRRRRSGTSTLLRALRDPSVPRSMSASEPVAATIGGGPSEVFFRGNPSGTEGAVVSSLMLEIALERDSHVRLHADSLLLASVMEKVASGDEAALAFLYDATSRRVYGLALRILGERESAEEITADVYVHAWRQASSWNPGRGSVEAWLLTMARSRAIDRLRAVARLKRREAPIDQEPHPVDVKPDPEAMSVAREDEVRVRRALARLNPLQRRAIEAAFFEGLSYTEVARKLGEPEGTVKTRIRAGLVALREALSPGEERRA